MSRAEFNATTKQAKRHNGTSCHQCKNIKTDNKLAFCSHLFDKRSKPEKRRCRKKYCSSCLQKFYNLKLENTQAGWACMSCRGMCVCAACARKGFILGYDEREDPLANAKGPGGMFMLGVGQPNMYVQQLLMQQAAQHQLGVMQAGEGYSSNSDDDEASDEKSSGAGRRMPVLDAQMLAMKQVHHQQMFQNPQFTAEMLAGGIPSENIPDMLQQHAFQQALMEQHQQQYRLAAAHQELIQDPQLYGTMWPGTSLNPLPTQEIEEKRANVGQEASSVSTSEMTPSGTAETKMNSDEALPRPAPPGVDHSSTFRSPMEFPASRSAAEAALFARNFGLLPPYAMNSAGLLAAHTPAVKHAEAMNKRDSTHVQQSPSSHSSGDDTTSPSPKASRRLEGNGWGKPSDGLTALQSLSPACSSSPSPSCSSSLPSSSSSPPISLPSPALSCSSSLSPSSPLPPLSSPTCSAIASSPSFSSSCPPLTTPKKPHKKRPSSESPCPSLSPSSSSTKAVKQSRVAKPVKFSAENLKSSKTKQSNTITTHGSNDDTNSIINTNHTNSDSGSDSNSNTYINHIGNIRENGAIISNNPSGDINSIRNHMNMNNMSNIHNNHYHPPSFSPPPSPPLPALFPANTAVDFSTSTTFRSAETLPDHAAFAPSLSREDVVSSIVRPKSPRTEDKKSLSPASEAQEASRAAKSAVAMAQAAAAAESCDGLVSAIQTAPQLGKGLQKRPRELSQDGRSDRAAIKS